MRLNNFLNEGSLYKKIKDKEVFKILKENCKQALNYYTRNVLNSNEPINYKLIWRGDPAIDRDFYLFKGKNVIRSSANTSNHYTVLFSELLPSWKNIPKRNRSLICSTSADDAFAYRTWRQSILHLSIW